MHKRALGLRSWLVLGVVVSLACRSDDGPNDELGDETSETDGDEVSTFGDGDGDPGDGDPGDGDPGDGDPGDGDPGDGDPGDGDPGDGDPGDGDPGDGDPGDGDPGDGDPGDGDPGDGDGDPGDGDPGDGDPGDCDPGDGDPGDGDPGDAPFVLATTPGDLATGVAPDTSVSISFSAVMDAATLTTNTADEACSGTLQVSLDDFQSCVPMAAAPTSDDEQTFTVTPATPLASATEYQIRVLASVTDAEGTAMAEDFTTDAGFAIRYFHTIEIDGINDFAADETFLSSTLGHVGYIAWDADYLYLGMNSPDLAGNDPQTWFVAYLGGVPGSDAGVLYNTQQPLLPFDARWHLRWKASDDFGGALEWTGASWLDPGFGPIAGSDDVASSGSFVELRVAWAELDAPELIEVHLGMLREQEFAEASWAAVPAGSHVDSYDPDYGSYYQFDRHGSTVPGDHEPL
jgi:hypothetical protein